MRSEPHALHVSEHPGSAVTTLLLIRHGEVENARQVLYGRLPNFRLSDAGQQQAERLAAFLADRPVTAIYSSPLLRARQTAAAIARHHPATERHVSALLHEVRSAWQGTPFTQFKPGFSTYNDRRAPDDESIEDIRARMLRFITHVRQRHPGGCIVAVSHGDPITILRVALCGRPLTLGAIRGADYADLCSVTEIAWSLEEKRLRMVYLPSPYATIAPPATASAAADR